MDYPDFEGISDIQDTSAMMSSRLSTNLSPRNNAAFTYSNPANFMNGPSFNSDIENSNSNQPSFLSIREYVENALNSFGLKIGYLSQNEDNKQTLKCLMQMISQRYKDTESKQKYKQKISQITFEKNKFNSFLDQAKKTIDEKNKKLGKVQNSFEELKTKMRKLQSQNKRQKDEDKKMITMLKGKNQQIMHEVKKRQQQVARVKQQMKKNIGEKNTAKSVNFEVFEVPKVKKTNEYEDKLELLCGKYEDEKKILSKQNTILKQKIYDIREEIVSLAEWIDLNIYGQNTTNYKNSLIVNHNLLFRKQCLVEELKEIIEIAKDGMNQIMQTRNQQLKYSNKEIIQSKQIIRSKELIQSPRSYEKKSKQMILSPRDHHKSPKNKNLVQSKNFKKKIESKEQIESRQTLPRQKKKSVYQDNTKTQIKSKQNLHEGKKKLQIQVKKEESIILGDDDSDLSIISHISMSEVDNKKQMYDKWDILFKE